MKLVAEKLGKSDKYDRLRFVRADGSSSVADMPRQGILPHDLVHFVVESALPLPHGFLSQVAAGAEVGFVMQAVHDIDNPAVDTGAIQAEALVEALQTQLWAGAFDLDSFLEAAEGASQARGKPAFAVAAFNPQATLYEPAQALLARWQKVPYHQIMELKFSPAAQA